eukprot:TRINITY_DN27468_c0_g4_i1.p1 TRINITY_DN27468_c0_g4~~TRINITY_DN27468_c0_g4_i1.p1  ORF type:complete len:431 (-),score=78.90 TRINITY_DN27468_c0_g4_i1:16-1269(-)
MGSAGSSLVGSHEGRSASTAAALATSAAVALGAASVALERARRRAAQEAEDLRSQLSRELRLRDEERRGRTRAEQRLRAALASAGSVAGDGDCDGAGADSAGGAAEQPQQLPEGEVSGGRPDGLAYTFQPIGEFRSCYRARCGTPRQGGVVKDSLATLVCSRDLNPAAALDGLAAFSHCWVLYVFHENTNLQREDAAVARRRQQRKGRVPPWQGLCMRVQPPRAPELKVGVLACRTPHRPNPIGLSLARIESINLKTGEVVLAGLDVVDGTPCLDLKPYLPAFESQPAATVPAWVQRSYDEPLMRVEWSADAGAQLEALTQKRLKLKPFESLAALRRALEGTLALDIRSPVQQKRHANPAAEALLAGSGAGKIDCTAAFFSGDLWFHELHVMYSLFPDPEASPPASVRIDSVALRGN